MEGRKQTLKTEIQFMSSQLKESIQLMSDRASNENGTASKLATITVSEKPVPVLPVADFGG